MANASISSAGKVVPGVTRKSSSAWLAAATLAERELVRFFRQRNRVVGALGQPLIFWVLFGAGLRSSFKPEGGNVPYEEYFFPGVLVLILLFTAIFATISIIEDRKEGFLQEVLIAPVPRSMVVLGKVLGGTALAMIQAWIFLFAAPFAGISISVMTVLLASVHLFVVGFALTSLGVCIAWRMDSTQGFHAIMSVFLMPMWLLSGAFFPAGGAPAWLEWTIRLNPLTYGVAGLRRILYWNSEGRGIGADVPSLASCVVVTFLFAMVTFVLATRLASRRGAEGS
ncbi:MAG: ABC transporter permease [Planctomycetota bacterium]